MKQTAAFPLVMAALASAAAPDVVAKDLPNTCQTYPGAHQVGQNGCEAIFQLYASSTGNPDVDGKHATHSASPAPEAWGSVAIVSEQDIAWPQFRYSDFASSGIFGLATNAQNPDTGDFQWTGIKLNADVDNLQLLYHYVVAGYPLSPYALYDAETESTQIPGVFLGLNGQVTWAFSVTKDDRGRDEYSFRLLANETAPLRGEEFEGFLRAGQQFEGVE